MSGGSGFLPSTVIMQWNLSRILSAFVPKELLHSVTAIESTYMSVAENYRKSKGTQKWAYQIIPT